MSEKKYWPADLKDKIRELQSPNKRKELNRSFRAPIQNRKRTLQEMEQSRDAINKSSDGLVQRVLHQRKEQKFFEREFAKDLKKQQEKEKLETELHELEENDPKNSKIAKLKRKLNPEKRKDCYEQFANDEIELDEFIEKVKAKKSKTVKK